MSRIPSDAFTDWPDPPPPDKAAAPWWADWPKMLLVIAILGVIIGLLPAVNNKRIPSHRTQSMNNLRQIGLGLYGYHHKYGAYPPPYSTAADGRPLLSWRVLILPYLDNEALYQRFNFDQPWDGPRNHDLIAGMPSIFRCPSDDPALVMTRYQVITGPGTPFDGAPHSESDIPDGTSCTILAIEAARPVPWTAPFDVPFDPTRPDDSLAQAIVRDSHSKTTTILLLDGSTRSLPSDFNPTLLRALATRDGGEPLEVP